jgi:hypothetical protein
MEIDFDDWLMIDNNCLINVFIVNNLNWKDFD